MGGKDNFCVMLVSSDEYQLPLATADSFRELARTSGLSYSALQKSYHTGKAIRLPKNKYAVKKGLVLRVNIEEVQDDD